jgi:hypothetical protein
MLNKLLWFLPKACGQEHDIPSRAFHIKFESQLHVLITFEVGNRFVRTHGSQIFDSVLLPVVVVLESELTESIELVEWLQSIRQEDKPLSKRKGARLRNSESPQSDLVYQHPLLLSVCEHDLWLCVVTREHLVII